MTRSNPPSQAAPGGLQLTKYSFGVGDRFAHQAKAQLRACLLAARPGLEIIPVWNKSNREHTIVGSKPGSVRTAAEAAVRELGWKKPFHVDADHITLETVEGFLESSDYYTLDVAAAIGKPALTSEVDSFLARHPELLERIELPGIDRRFDGVVGEEAFVVLLDKSGGNQGLGRAFGFFVRHLDAEKSAVDLLRLHPQIPEDVGGGLRRPPALAGNVFDQECLYQGDASAPLIQALLALDGETIEEAIHFKTVFG
jgi:hypothetical protein